MILETHPNIELTDFTYEVVKTIDNPKEGTFTPHVHVIATNIRYPIHHELPSQPYINGTWSDDDVQNAVNVYFSERLDRKNIQGQHLYKEVSNEKNDIKKKPYLCPIKKWIKKLLR